MGKLTQPLIEMIPALKRRLSIDRGCAYRIVAVGFSKKGNLLGISVNGHRNDLPIQNRGGMGQHAEAALIKKFGRRIDKIYILRVGRSLDILPIHPCECCFSMAEKIGAKIIPMHEFLI